jgi:hypothetical protein
METTSSPTTSRLTPWWLVLLIAMGMLVLGDLLHSALWSTDSWEGIKCELAHLPRMPIGLLLWLGLRLFGLQKYRTWAVLAPFGYLLLLPVFDIPTASNRQQHFTLRALPKSASDMQTHFSGSSTDDYSLIYYFKCTAAETDEFIRDLKLEPNTEKTADDFTAPPFPAWPNQQGWPQPSVFTRIVPEGRWTYCLKTDQAHEQVYFSIHCSLLESP